MPETDLQKELFVLIKNTLPSHISLVDTIADLLNISYDSVYRRIRGEKPISLNELKVLCEHFHVSLDQVLQFKNNTVVFNAPEINGTINNFSEYLKGLLSQMKNFNSFPKREMFYQCKDAPLFYFYMFPEIGAFKTFCWNKTILNTPDLKDKIFSLDEFPFKECYQLGQQIIKENTMLPSVELWNSESFNSSINQLEYYRDAGLFKSESDFLEVLNSFGKLLDHLQEQARLGCKFMPANPGTNNSTPFRFYVNQVILGNNSVVLKLGDQQMSLITYNVLYYLLTKDARFSEKLHKGFNTLLESSTLISGTGEKERNRFFKLQREKIAQLKK
jgi:hypothetical protein